MNTYTIGFGTRNQPQMATTTIEANTKSQARRKFRRDFPDCHIEILINAKQPFPLAKVRA